MDVIADILRHHIDLAERQLALAEGGITFSVQEDEGTEFIAVTEAQLRQRVSGLRARLQRHESDHA